MTIGPERSCTSCDPVQKDVRCQMTERLCHRKDIFVPEESRKGNPKDRGKREACFRTHVHQVVTVTQRRKESPERNSSG